MSITFLKGNYLQLLKRSQTYKFSKVRFISDSGSNDIIDLSSAFDAADKASLDLVCVSDESNPPVCKVLDFNKIKFESKKSKKVKKQRVSVLKEIQFKVNISDHDFETKLKNISKFLERGDKVKVLVRLKGREKEHPERADELIKRVIESVPCKVNPLPGPMSMVILEKDNSGAK